MNVGGGEAADQMVRMMLSGTEVAVRLSGSALKNLLALTMALAKNRKTVSGKVNMRKMLRETQDLRRFPMTPEQYKEFQKLARKHKLLYSVIRDKDDRGRLLDVILPVTELDRANGIFERILYTMPPEPERREPLQGREVFRQERQAPERLVPERQPPEREPHEQAVSRPQEDRQRQARPQREASQRSAVQGRQKAAAARRSQNTPKKDSRSERDLSATKRRSSISRESGAARRTSNRPSVEARLKAYQAQLKNPSAPAREISKAKNIARPQTKER